MYAPLLHFVSWKMFFSVDYVVNRLRLSHSGVILAPLAPSTGLDMWCSVNVSLKSKPDILYRFGI